MIAGAVKIITIVILIITVASTITMSITITVINSQECCRQEWHDQFVRQVVEVFF